MLSFGKLLCQVIAYMPRSLNGHMNIFQDIQAKFVFNRGFNASSNVQGRIGRMITIKISFTIFDLWETD
ncbi:MAG: hypothetical protein COB67_07620 [SAR324 cluster bacterium]|uniref:Uncharacterized protein n=1 Tax=SAR324 cluster bacterium TaxID=2024889 RepID=A0A2A4T3E9_9DELT|nr:MAG: hypothetical protein COB67_07620 [SAR324 cluster bacterium]